jgi:hypothetical protein
MCHWHLIYFLVIFFVLVSRLAAFTLIWLNFIDAKETVSVIFASKKDLISITQYRTRFVIRSYQETLLLFCFSTKVLNP